MGTVLSFSPRERRPVYSTHHHSGTLSSSGSSDFPLNNYSYEQLNNVKNRENTKSSLCTTLPNNNGNLLLLGQTHNNHHTHLNHHINGNNNSNNNNNNSNNNGNNNNNNNNNSSNGNSGNTINNNTNHLIALDRSNDSARILSEKNALEKNLKKHSLFINALSWKRLAASHSKKKLDNNKNKVANLPTATFRPPLVDAIHPLAIDKNKNIQQQNQQHQVYFTPGAPKALLALDLVRVNNTNNIQQTDKLAQKLPLSLPLPLQAALTQQQSQQPQQHTHGPRKTVIQVRNTKFHKKSTLFFPKFINHPRAIQLSTLDLILCMH